MRRRASTLMVLLLLLACAGEGPLDPSETAAVFTVHPDKPGNGVPGGPNKDADADGVLNGGDNCALAANPDQADLDEDAAGDACDADDDGDSVPDAGDNCPRIGNAAQEDRDGDGIGNACDPVVVRATLPPTHCYDLETGATADIGYGPCPPGFDFSIGGCYCEGAILLQNQDQPVAIAHLRDRAFESVFLEDTTGAGFTNGIIEEPISATRVILLITADLNVYKVGNPAGLTGGDVVFDVARLNGLE